MTTPIARSNTPRQLIPGALNAILGMSYGEVVGELDGLFDEKTSDKYFEEVGFMTGFGLAPNKTEGGAIFYDTARETWVARAEHEVVGLGFQITEEQIEDNQYMNMAQALAKKIGRSMGQTKEQKKANVINNGFNSAYTQGPNGDGQPLFSASHPTIGDGNQSNLLTADLSETALESALISISKAKDDRGLYINLRAKSLWVPAENQFVAHRILKSDGRVGTADNDTNALKDMNMFPGGLHISRRFTDSDSWYIRTDLDGGLMFFTRTPLQTKQEGDFDTGNIKFKARERYSAGPWGDWRAVYGSSGV
jgi:hypothetical protein